MDPNAPGQMSPGAVPPPPPPEWGVVAPTQSAGSGMGAAVGGALGRRLLGALGTIIVIVVIVGGIFVYEKVANPGHHGQVLYSTNDQSSQSDCTVTDQVSSVKVGSPVYAIYFWEHRLTVDQKVTEEDFKDGVSIGTYDIPTDKSADADCLVDQDNLSTEFTDPGKYEIKLTVGTEVVADGTVTITP